MASSCHGRDGDTAPIYTIPPRRLGALEHPMIIKNLDKGIKTFGQNNAFRAILDSASPQISVPLYLRYDNPTARPLTSHNALTHNVVLKVTVPKRTGRKRKRGTNGPWEWEVEQPSAEDPALVSPEVLSRDRLDTPRVIRRKLQDNVGKYTVEPVGVVNNTHRYRGLADFQYSLGESRFMKHFVEKVLPGDVSKLKEFSLQPGIESGTNIDLIPPPYFTPITLPFSYNYAQNPHTKEISLGPSDATGDLSEDQEYGRVVNITSRAPAAGYFIAHDEYPVPSGPRREPDMSDPQVAAIITEMRQAMEERPIWTRRSMWNRLGAKFAELPKNGGLVRHCLQYAGYQFKGGPWRDALVKYGLDPRSDPKYRIYQTLIFKLHKTRVGSVGRSWQALRRKELGVSNFGKAWKDMGAGDDAMLNTHIFNGESFSTDGKVWQVCDITDPLLARLFAEAEVRPECDVEISGFYHRALWSVAKAIMKCKMVAIRFNRTLTDSDFSAALEAVKNVPQDGGGGGGGGSGSGSSMGISLPDLQLTAAEYEQLRGGKFRPRPGIKSSGREVVDGVGRRRRTHYRVRIPLKETEEREAVKMIKLLTHNTQGKEAAGETSAAATEAEGSTPGEEVLRETPAGATDQDVRPARTGEEEQDEKDEGEEEQREGRAFQEVLEDMDEEDSEEEDEEEGDESEEDEEGVEMVSQKKYPFHQENESEDDLDQEEEYEEGVYSDEDDQEDVEDEDEDEDEDEEEYAGGDDDEEEELGEKGEGFSQTWEDDDGDGGEDGQGYYE
ncbi:RNA polymerase III transcription factor IIIC subunit-domain-containing protein [Thermothelomyces heterothallicus CBS 202.75]|uniref:RNA polymerase III transcription factor IIIC subunit-domain-containing protein n=1 Tax=Thermothelomyces heterothallicus CBS 202.75 TaxID=1149848 RepID=UPI0037436DDA